ncbi:MAG: alpha/beta fold hydrolase [Bacteroidota bacterium]
MHCKIKFLLAAGLIAAFCTTCSAQSSNDTLVLQDIQWNNESHATSVEFNIPSSGSKLQGFIYKANGNQKHPTLLLLHGYPGNERNLDLAQVVRSRGWNVIYFDYRGSWASQGKFSFKNCVEDVVNVVSFCKKNANSLLIDTSNIVLFGHSMGGWVCLKALQQLPTVKKGFALSTWDIYGELKGIKTEEQLIARAKQGGEYFVLNSSIKEIFDPVYKNPAYFNLSNGAKALAGKKIIMLDEHDQNKKIAEDIKSANQSYFDYQVWQTDHPFTNKRVAVIKMVLEFLAK